MIKIYSAAKMLANDNNYLISSSDRHTGPVRALDFNPFQANLLATGAAESEIYIWDIVNANSPMTPGSRSQPLEDVQHIAWNKQGIFLIVKSLRYLQLKHKYNYKNDVFSQIFLFLYSATYSCLYVFTTLCYMGFKKRRTYYQINRCKFKSNLISYM